jgi:DNA modification methylase
MGRKRSTNEVQPPVPQGWRNRIVGYGEEAPDQLLAHDKNWRIHPKNQQDALAGVLREVGLVQNVIVNRRTGKVVDGHLRVSLAISENQPTVPITFVDLDEKEEALILASLDPLSAMAGTDKDLLAGLLGDLGAIPHDDAVVALLAELAAQAHVISPREGEDDAPPPPEHPVSRRGDLWQCGPHRVSCGDATIASDVARLMQVEKADLVFTDPPYNVDYEGYTDEKLKIQGDRLTADQFAAFLRAAFGSYQTIVKPGASLYICHPSSWQREFQDALEACGFAVRCQIIWAKNTFAWGFGRYKFQHEPMFYCHIADQSDAWYGDKAQSTLWQENKPAANRLHPTMKPVELVERALLNSSKAGDSVVDLFGGAGSTLIACEKTNRRARLMELDAKYCDVITKRWQQFSNKQARLDGDGRTFDQVGRDKLGEHLGAQDAIKEEVLNGT